MQNWNKQSKKLKKCGPQNIPSNFAQRLCLIGIEYVFIPDELNTFWQFWRFGPTCREQLNLTRSLTTNNPIKCDSRLTTPLMTPLMWNRKNMFIGFLIKVLFMKRNRMSMLLVSNYFVGEGVVGSIGTCLMRSQVLELMSSLTCKF